MADPVLPPDLQYDITVTPEPAKPPATFGYGEGRPGVPAANPATDHAANLVSYYESGGKNIPNYRWDLGHTAGGIYQITNTNWRKYAPLVGIDLNLYPSALSAPGNVQRAVFDRMYLSEGFGPWSNYNPRLAEALGSGRMPVPGWTPSPRSIDSEQNKSNADVRYMTPEEYLSLLPPIEDNEASKAKKQNLKTSLDGGDNIEEIPSLDVTRRGDNLVVADWDGRNRAQAAIAAGADEIPVSIRGVPQGEQDKFKLLVGNKKVSLPYTFVKVPKSAAPRPLVTAEQQARQIVPQAFVPAPSAPIVPPAPAPMVPPQAPVAEAGTGPVPAKPNFYPEIAAGINKDIINPAGAGYRGVGVPDLATNATASGRIAAANAGSAGQIGLGGTIGSSLGSALSAINPIGSAQAAEPATPPLESPQTPPVFTRDANPGQSSPPIFTRDQAPPQSWVPDIPGAATIAPPLVNFLLAYPRAVAAGGVAAIQELLNPKSMADWSEKKAKIDSDLQMRETPAGNAISKVLNSPGLLLSAAINEMAEERIGGLTPERVEAAAPYLDLIGTILPGLGLMHLGIGRVLSAPARGVLSRAVRSPEMRAVAAVNRHQEAELAAGGRTAPAIANEIARAQQLGIPTTVGDFTIEGGPQESFLRHALEHSPEATAMQREFLTDRTQGISTGALTAPTGGTLERSERATEEAFGPGSAYEFEKANTRNLNTAAKALGRENRALITTQNQIASRERDLKFAGGKATGITPLGLARDPELIKLRTSEARLKRSVKFIDDAIRELGENKKGLDLGQKILARSTKVEKIRNFLSTASPAAKQHLQIGVKDALQDEYRHSLKSREPFRIENLQANKDKVVAAFDGNNRAATDLMDSIKAEAAISTHSKNILDAMKRDKSFWGRQRAQLLQAAEAGLHVGAALMGLGHVYSGGYWGIRGARYGANILSTGGGLAARTKGQEIARLFSSLNPRLSPTGMSAPSRFRGVQRPELFETPARPGPQEVQLPFGPPRQVYPASSQRGINTLSRASIPLSYGALAPKPDAPAMEYTIPAQ